VCRLVARNSAAASKFRALSSDQCGPDIPESMASVCANAVHGSNFAAQGVPFYNRTQHNIVAHVHIAKMAGRETLLHFPVVAKLQFCPFQGDEWNTWTANRSEELRTNLAKHCAATQEQCFFTWENNWDLFQQGCTPAILPYTGKQPFYMTLLRSPTSWVFSALAHYGKTGEEAASRDARGESFAGPYSFGIPLNRLTGGSVPTARKISTALHNLRGAAFGLVEDVSASFLLILWQLGLSDQARSYCGASHPSLRSLTEVEHLGFGSRNGSFDIDIRRYATAQWLANAPAIQPYACVYSVAATEFYHRLAKARGAVCPSS